MTAATYRGPSISTNQSYAQGQMMPGSNGASKNMLHARQADNSYEDEPEYIPFAPEVPKRVRPPYLQHPSAMFNNHKDDRSFSARTKDLGPDWDFIPQHELAPQQVNDMSAGIDDAHGQLAEDASLKGMQSHTGPTNGAQSNSPKGSESPASPSSRENTVQYDREQRRDWAHDRSPLQKLEVTLSGISKEEKRARVLEAEMRLKERLARQKIERDKQESASRNVLQPVPSNKPEIQSTIPERTPPARASREDQPSASERRPGEENQRPRHQRLASEGYQRMAPRALGREVRPGQPEKPQNLRNSWAPSSAQYSIVQYPTVHAGPAPQYAYPDDNVSAKDEINRGQKRPVTRGNQPSAQITYRSPSTWNGGPNTQGISPHLQPTSPTTVRPLGVEELKFQNRQPQQPPQPPYHISTDPQDEKIHPTWRNQPHVGITNLPSSPTDAPPAGSMTRVNISNTPSEWRGFSGRRNNAELGGEQTGLAMPSKPKKPSVSFDMPPPTPPPLTEWKDAPVAKLSVIDFDFERLDADRNKAWWEGGRTSDRRKSRALPNDYQKSISKIPEFKRLFQPPLYLKCGPLLRYAGMKREILDGPEGPVEKEWWRGSIMIVTESSRSTYNLPPTLRLFPQPMDLLPPPPAEVQREEGAQLAPEYVDPIVGVMKIGRDGKPLYVKPVEHLQEQLDLSLLEDENGIYELSPSIVDYDSNGAKQALPSNRVHTTDGETAGTYKEIPGIRLHDDPDRGVTFWRFNLEIELSETQQRIAYRINHGPAVGFWIPPKGKSMNIAFYTGNGFSLSVDSNQVCGPDPLWRDILNEHQTRPFHVMIGGGDQIFNDHITIESPLFREWLAIKQTSDKHSTSFNPEIRAELETLFLDRYCMWFSQGLFSLASSQIPMINMWNDHELIEGFGSYSDQFMRAPIITGLGKLAFKYYLLFQHHSLIEETEVDEPSWLLGAHSGPYIKEKSRNLFMFLGKKVAFLGLDCRTERVNDEVIGEQTCDRIWDRCHREIIKGETEHLIVLSSVPVAYPRVAMIKDILNSRKSLGKAGIFGGLVNKRGGNVPIFDDHWMAKHHKAERQWLIEDLQDLAAEKSVRVTILSGDVHLAAIGQFYSNPKLELPKDRDYRYMPNVISSPIADFPETEIISNMLNQSKKVHHVDSNTDENMIPIFTHDVDGKSRNNKRLLPRRNWCSIREYQPGTTPPATSEQEAESLAMRFRPRKLQRTLSLGRGDRPKNGLFRRLSLRGPPPTKEFNLLGDAAPRPMSMDGAPQPAETASSYLPQQQEEFHPDPSSLLRRPTNLSQRTAVANEADGAAVNLDGGLAITLNLEVNLKDPAGITTPYTLVVPPLRYEGNEYDPPATQVAKGWRKWLKMGRKKQKSYLDQGPASDDDEAEQENGEHQDEAGYEGYPGSEAEDLPPGQTARYDANPSGKLKSMKKWFGKRL